LRCRGAEICRKAISKIRRIGAGLRLCSVLPSAGGGVKILLNIEDALTIPELCGMLTRLCGARTLACRVRTHADALPLWPDSVENFGNVSGVRNLVDQVLGFEWKRPDRKSAPPGTMRQGSWKCERLSLAAAHTRGSVGPNHAITGVPTAAAQMRDSRIVADEDARLG